MLPLHEEERKFKRSLETGRSYSTRMWGEERSATVKAIGRLSSPQFTMLMRPSEYSASWLDMNIPVDYTPGQVHYQTFQESHPEYEELEKSIMKEGVRRPVIVGQKQHVLLPDVSPDAKDFSRTPARPVLDGHHRAFFAIKHGLHIPVVQIVPPRR